MKIVVSPAKSLDFESPLPTGRYSHPCFLEEAAYLNQLLRKQSPKKLASLMGISEKLAQLNWQRNQQFNLPLTPGNARPAVYAFNGDVYRGLDVYTLPLEKIESLQKTVRILSGMYGLLKPLDLIQPYRLEMSIPFRAGKSKDLYAFWKRRIAQKLNEEIQEGELFLNLASEEYAGALDNKALKTPVITPKFKDLKNGTLKTISFFAKKARGLMARYVLDTNAETLDQVKQFHYEGYRFSPVDTQRENDPVFVR